MRVDLIGRREDELRGGREQTELRHDLRQADRLKKGGLSPTVRSGHDGHRFARGEVDVTGDDPVRLTTLNPANRQVQVVQTAGPNGSGRLVSVNGGRGGRQSRITKSPRKPDSAGIEQDLVGDRDEIPRGQPGELAERRGQWPCGLLHQVRQVTEQRHQERVGGIRSGHRRMELRNPGMIRVAEQAPGKTAATVRLVADLQDGRLHRFQPPSEVDTDSDAAET